MRIHQSSPPGAGGDYGEAAAQLQAELPRLQDGAGDHVALAVPGGPHHLGLPHHQPHQRRRGHTMHNIIFIQVCGVVYVGIGNRISQILVFYDHER